MYLLTKVLVCFGLFDILHYTCSCICTLSTCRCELIFGKMIDNYCNCKKLSKDYKHINFAFKHNCFQNLPNQTIGSFDNQCTSTIGAFHFTLHTVKLKKQIKMCEKLLVSSSWLICFWDRVKVHPIPGIGWNFSWFQGSGSKRYSCEIGIRWNFIRFQKFWD